MPVLRRLGSFGEEFVKHLDRHGRSNRQGIGNVAIAFSSGCQLQPALVGKPGAAVPRQRTANGHVAAFQEGVRDGFVEGLSPRNCQQVLLAAMICDLDQIAFGKSFGFAQHRSGDGRRLMAGETTDHLAGSRLQCG